MDSNLGLGLVLLCRRSSENNMKQLSKDSLSVAPKNTAKSQADHLGTLLTNKIFLKKHFNLSMKIEWDN